MHPGLRECIALFSHSVHNLSPPYLQPGSEGKPGYVAEAAGIADGGKKSKKEKEEEKKRKKEEEKRRKEEEKERKRLEKERKKVVSEMFKLPEFFVFCQTLGKFL